MVHTTGMYVMTNPFTRLGDAFVIWVYGHIFAAATKTWDWHDAGLLAWIPTRA
jgi:hypothetical protein